MYANKNKIQLNNLSSSHVAMQSSKFICRLCIIMQSAFRVTINLSNYNAASLRFVLCNKCEGIAFFEGILISVICSVFVCCVHCSFVTYFQFQFACR